MFDDTALKSKVAQTVVGVVLLACMIVPFILLAAQGNKAEQKIRASEKEVTALAEANNRKDLAQAEAYRQVISQVRGRVDCSFLANNSLHAELAWCEFHNERY